MSETHSTKPHDPAHAQTAPFETALQAVSLPLRLADYELLGEIARGAMGIVYRARQIRLNRIVAVKMIVSGNLASPTAVSRFRDEAEAAAALTHPNVLPVYEVGEAAGYQFFSMKLAEGGSLADCLTRPDRPPLRELIQLLAQVARAVHFAHQHGVLHRDLKPGNILLDPDRTPYVADFGLAKRFSPDSSAVSQSGAIIGTPSYMPPEQASGDRTLTVAADVYSLGAILYELLTGRPPFREDSTFGTVHAVLTADPVPPHQRVPGCDPDLSAVSLACLAKEPSGRYASAAVFAEELERWLRGEGVSARLPGAWGLTRQWIHRNALGVAACLLVGTFLGAGVGFAVGGLEFRLIHGGGLASDESPLGRLVRSVPETLHRTFAAIVAALGLGIGIWVNWITRPRDSAGTLSVAVLTGMTAAVVGFLFLGPIWVLRVQAGLRPESGVTIPPATSGKPSLPPPTDVTGAFAGTALGLFRAVLLLFGFTVYATFTYRWITTRGEHGFAAALRYLELALPVLAALTWAALDVTYITHRYLIGKTPESGRGVAMFAVTELVWIGFATTAWWAAVKTVRWPVRAMGYAIWLVLFIGLRALVMATVN